MIFNEIKPQDARWAHPLLEMGGYKSCEYAFSNIYMWSEVYNTKIARLGDFVIARSEGKRLHYLYPAGSGDVNEAIRAILQDAKEDGRKPVIFSLDENAKQDMEKNFAGQFIYDKPRGQADYIYLAQDLAQLSGKKLQKKRNHCSRFERQYPNWTFGEIMLEDLDAVLIFNNRWCDLYDNRDDAGIAAEHRAIELALGHYDELKLKGGFLTVDGEVVAFSFGSPLGKEMFVTHVEKALYDVSGAYAMINREMARAFCQGYKYINRENDLDEEGLREAKLSYHPVMLEEKYTAELVQE